MVTANISLPDDQMARLRLLALASHRSLDEVMREAVDRYLANMPETSEANEKRLTPPDVSPASRAAALAALAHLHAHVARDLSPSEIEHEITLAADEARQERMAKREQARG